MEVIINIGTISIETATRLLYIARNSYGQINVRGRSALAQAYQFDDMLNILLPLE
jgi:hypothetical protein